MVTKGIRSFTTTPYVFAVLDRARAYTGTPSNKTTYLLLYLAAGADVENVRSRLKATLAKAEVLTPDLNLLVPRLPAPQAEDLSKGILEAIDMDSYRVQKKATMKIALADQNAEIAPGATDGGGGRAEPEMDRLSNILKTFNERFGTLFKDADRVVNRIRHDIAPKVAADVAYKNAKENTPHTARMAHDQALSKVMQTLLKEDAQVYKQFVENEYFKRFLSDMVYDIT